MATLGKFYSGALKSALGQTSVHEFSRKLQPRRPQTEHINKVWLRFYGATDLTAWVSQGEVKFASAVRDTRDVFVGREDAWAKGPLPLECGRRGGIYFARLTQAGP